MSDSKDSRGARRLEAVRSHWGMTGLQMAGWLDVKQPTMSRMLGGNLKPGRTLAGRIADLFEVPVSWWDQLPLEKEPEPLPDPPEWLRPSDDNGDEPREATGS